MKTFKCDNCAKKDGEDITLILHGELYDFCSLSCAIEFLSAEQNKLNPRKNIEFGKKEN